MADETIRIVVEGQDKASATLSNVAHAMQAVTGGIMLAQQAYRLYDATLGQAIRETVKYADQVRKLSAISGESTESTSRFIQVLDDYSISAEDALTATRTLTKQGHAPSIATLAKLSDEYLGLNSAQAKNELILKNLGRGGLQWVEVLKQGSAAIIAQGDAVRDELILSQEAVRQAREYELAVDDLNDAKLALSVTIGSKLLPVLTQFLTDLATGPEVSRNLRIALVELERQGIDPATRGYIAMAQAMQSADVASEDMTESLKSLISLQDQLTSAFEGGGKDIERSIHKITIAMLEQKMMLDGELAPAEYAILTGLKVSWGLLSDEVRDQSDALFALIADFDGSAAGARRLQAAIDALHGKSININVNYLTSTAQGAGQRVTTGPPTGVTQSRASGGQLNGNWTLVGDAPGGRLTAYSELISPSGRVFPAAQTRAMLAGGLRPRSAATGTSSASMDDPTLGVPWYLQRYEGSQFLSDPSGGGGGGGGGKKSIAQAVTSAAVASARSASVTSAALEEQMQASQEQNETLISEMRMLRRDIALAVRDAVQAVV
jgi:hypothetical protein